MDTGNGPGAYIPLGEFLTTEEPVWVWDASSRRILWANQAGRDFWGADSLDALRSRRFPARNKTIERLSTLALQAGEGWESVEMLTLAAASGRRAVKCYVQGLEVAGGSPGLIVKALEYADSRESSRSAEPKRTPPAPLQPRSRRRAENKSDQVALDAIAARMKKKSAAPTPAPSPDPDRLALHVRELCHEMRNPLSVILGFAERIRDIAPAGKQQDRLRAYAGDIIEGANLAMAILGDFSTRMLRPEDSAPAPEPIDLRGIVEACLRLIAPVATASGIRIHRRIERDLPPLLAAERVLKQILLNLLMNALRHHKTGGLIRVTARRRKDGAVRLAIADDGRGMTKKDIRTALHTPRKSPPQSGRSGLGLPLVKRLVESIGGRIAIDSVRGKGTTVEIVFPAQLGFTEGRSNALSLPRLSRRGLCHVDLGFAPGRLHRFIGFERLAPPLVMLDHRQRIALAQRHPGLFERCLWRFPRRMDVLGRQFRELGHPAADIGPLRVELLSLQDRIEDAEIRRGVGAGPGDPLPARRIVGEVGVDQRVPEPVLAGAPRDQQMLGQQRGDDHPYTVVHPADRPELAQPGIDDRITGAALLPGGQRSLVLLPGQRCEFRTERALRQMRPVKQEMVGELPPIQLADIGSGAALQFRIAFRRRLDGMPDLPRADLAESQKGRQPRGAVNTGTVAAIAVTGKGIVDEIGEPLSGPRLARRPECAHVARPVRLRRLQAPVREPVAIGPSARGARAFAAPSRRPRAAP